MTEHYEEVSIRHRRWLDDPNRAEVFAIQHDGVESDEHRAWSDADPTERGEEPAFDEVKHYTMPASPNGGLALKYLKKSRPANQGGMGQEAAAGWLIEQAIGSEAYDALADEPDLDEAVILKIAGRINSIALGSMRDKAPKA